MAGNILNIGKSGLFAAQVGLSTTGHNIANANVAGYSRQVVVQASGAGQDLGVGFIGSGTKVAEILRYSDDFLNGQVRQAQSSTSALNTFHTQINQIDNLLADTTSGLSPALQDFFKSVQDVSAAPTSTASRQSMLSTAESLASRFQGLNGRMQEVREGVNSQIATNVTVINSYTSQIAQLNEQINALSTDPTRPPNDLMDKRDQIIADLNKQVKVNVVKGEANSVTVSIGSGQPLVVGKKAFQLALTTSPTDLQRSEIGYVNGTKVSVLPPSTFSGGELGGLLDFRSNALDRAQNSLGRVAIGMAMSFNAQHELGVDQAGAPGATFFKVADPVVTRNANNDISSTTAVSAVIKDAGALTQSDYKLSYSGGTYSVARLPDGVPVALAVGVAQVIDGVEYTVTGTAVAGDNFSIRPTVNGAAQFGVLVNDRSKIAAASAVISEAAVKNTGSGKIGGPVYDSTYMAPGNQLAGPVKLTFAQDAALASVFSAPVPVTVTVAGVTTAYAALAPIPYSAASGATVTAGGVSVDLSGAPDVGDTFTIRPTPGGADDNRNMRALGDLQLKNILDGGKTNFQSSYAELVSFVGNKTREAQVGGQAGEAMLAQARLAQQDVSGVNLDEEATNLLRYQQAYQAAGKVMQIAGQLFDTLLSLGR